MYMLWINKMMVMINKNVMTMIFANSTTSSFILGKPHGKDQKDDDSDEGPHDDTHGGNLGACGLHASLS